MVEGRGGSGGAAGPAAADALVITAYSGEVTNSPTCTVARQPGQVAVPIRVQWLPSAES